MRKILISIVCTVFLSIGSVASADPLPLTSSLKFYGAGIYLGGEEPSFDGFHGIGIVHYDLKIADLDWNATYNWTLDYEIQAKGISKFENKPTQTFNINETEYGIGLGTFALADGYGNKLLDAKNYIESMPNLGTLPGLGVSYMHFGNWNEGNLLLGLSNPIDGLEFAAAGIKGEVRLNANAVAPVPEPATMLLFGTGLAGLAGLRFRKKVKKN